MTLADFTAPGLVVPQLRGRDVAGVIQELGEALRNGRRVPDLRAFCQAALERERLVSTDTEAGMAFPHARLDAVHTLTFAFGRATQLLPWRPGAGASVRFVFLIAVPPADSAQYLQLISGLVRLSKDASARTALETAPATPDLVQVFARVSVRPSVSPAAAAAGAGV